MNRLIAGAMLGTLLLTEGLVGLAWSADMKVIQTQKTKDVVITLMSESGQWKQGKNTFVLEFTSAKDKQPVDAGKVSLSTSMTMTGHGADDRRGDARRRTRRRGAISARSSFPTRVRARSP